ncbi:hypothetical protein U9R90_07260 [Streptomyces sp. E11-3]|uniref:hypothetical protein n=1 Tax=Streptomyces sp. E11-3 TaxID=3110112 RepID=UPI00397F4D5A
MLFYFGWASTDAETQTLGLHPTLFRFSTADYLLRSVDALYIPVLLAMAAALAATAAHRWVHRVPPRRAGRVLRPLRYAWGPALLLLPFYALSPALFELLIPLALLAGAPLTAYALTHPRPEDPSASDADRRRSLRLWGPAVLIAVLALFWSVSSYAEIVGRGRAALTADTVADGFPAVVAFSKDDLLIRGGGSCLAVVAEKGSPYRYRYAGLRLFHVSGDRLFLVPRHWSPQDGTLFIVEESADLRVEYVSGQDYRRTRECP